MSTVLNKTQATPPTGKVSPQLPEAEAWQQGQEQHIILLKKLGGDTCKRLTFTHEHGQDENAGGSERVHVERRRTAHGLCPLRFHEVDPPG